MSTHVLFYVIVTGAAVLASLMILRRKPPKRKPNPKRCPNCGGESFETEVAGHAELADYSDQWFWYGTCQTCKGHCASEDRRLSSGEWQYRFYVPAASEWEDRVERPSAESHLRQVAEDALKEQEYRKYKWPFDHELP